MPVTQYGVGTGLQDMGLISGGAGFTYLNNITAHAGGLQPAAVPLTAAMNRVTVVGTAGDSVALPVAYGGQAITVINASATSMNVFSSNASTADTINGVAGTTAYAIAAGKTADFMSFPGAWHALLSA
jgi:hypothetical protein